MPSSTVFSYWRREHRRSSASPVPQPISKAVDRTSEPPRLPLITDSTTFAAAFDESFPSNGVSTLRTSADYFSDFDGGKPGVSVSTVDAPSPSSQTLTVPSSASEDPTRPRSSPGERERELSTLTSQPNYSQPSFSPLTQDHQTNGDSSKPSSPFRKSFGKGILNSQSVDSHSKRSSTLGRAPSSHRRFRTSPDEPPGDKISTSQKEHRSEGHGSRRSADRDMQPVESVSQKSGKTKLHLLNPMALLARRRSYQIASLRAEDMNIGARNLVPAIPDDYDPRIRGNIVHDFSAPRPRRHLSAAPVLLHESIGQSRTSTSNQNNRTGSETNVLAKDSGSTTTHLAEQGRKPSDHSPVFREHFDDDGKVLQVENKAYLQSSLLTDPSHRNNDPQAIPVFARKLPSSIAGHETSSDEQPKRNDRVEAAETDASREGKDADTIEIGPQLQLSGLPKHLKSNASRFSFDMNGVGSSTQEKLLEEKHKEKEAARRAQRLEDGEFSDVEDDYDNDLHDELDGFEEEIPGVNVDADEDDVFKGFSGPGNILNKSWLAPNLSPVIASPVNPEIPRGEQLAASNRGEPSHSTSFLMGESPEPADGVTESSNTLLPGSNGLSTASSRPVEDDDDDLYFDDGEFGDLSAGDGGETFDETIFDDPTSHLYDRKQPTQVNPAVQIEEKEVALEPGQGNGLQHVPSMASVYRETGPRRYGSIAGNVPNADLAKAHNGVLSEHNLEAFHNALADAANQAATNSQFGRSTSVSERSLGQESSTQTADSQPGLVSDESRLSQAADLVSFDEVFEEFNYDDNDDLLYDDPIIAAANAEALENDDEGFYGQEFGFYAHAHGADSELTNGGYFGPRGVEGISRSHSGRGKFREPSLTPITERSEWSTRNSIISVSAHGIAHSNQSVSGPGLAQLVDMGNLDDEMSLGALMKLRRDAWGGSNGSLRSSSGSPPPQHHSASNRGSFALSDVSPTVHAFPPDFLGLPAAIDSPIKESEKGLWVHSLPQQRQEIPMTESESQA